jgi:hypothetical protein
MCDAEAALRRAVEQCYTAFASFPHPSKLHASPLRDGNEILRTLSSAPLRELSGEQIGPYSGWAITTVGDERDYRHFLPRIFEISVSDPAWLGVVPPVMASRLNMGSWREWPAEQRAAALKFFRAAFAAVIERHPHSAHAADEWFCALVTLGESPSLNFERWRSSKSPHAALQLASFVINEARHLVRHEEVRGSFWEDVPEGKRREIAALLVSDAARHFLEAASGRVSEEDRFFLVDAALAELQRQF